MPKYTCGVSAAAVIVAVAGWRLLDSGHLTARGIGDAVLLALSAVAFFCTVATLRAAHGRQRRAWQWQSGAVAAWLVAAVLAFYYTVVRGMEVAPFPSVVDVVDLLYPLAACVALLLFPVSNLRFRARVLFDGVIVAIALFEVIWQLSLNEVYRAGPHSPWRFAIMVAYPVTDVLVAAVAVIVLTRVGGAQRTVVALLAAGAVLNTVSDSANVYTYTGDAGTALTVLTYVASAGSIVLMTLAAMVARRTSEVVDPERSWLTSVDFWLPYGALALAIVVCGPGVLVPLARGPLLATTVVLLLALAMRHLLVLLDNRRLHIVVSDQALRDPLTGLANRALFRDRVAHSIHLRQRDNRSVAVVGVDLNEFRRVNAEFGQAVGDELLVLVAERLMTSVRAGDTVARIGADEFAVLMEGSPDRARIVAHRVVRAFDEPFVIGARAISVCPSVGFAMAASETDDVSAVELMEQVDVAMTKAKSAGDRRLHTFTEDMRSMVRTAEGRGSSDEVVLLRDLRRAIDDGALSVLYQPKVDLHTGAPVGVEALVRWPHREHGLLGPDYFLPLVRQHGLMGGVTELVLGRALDDVAAWAAAGVRVPVSVNLSAPSAADMSLPARIARELASRGLDPTILTVEITEDLLLENTERASGVLDRLRASGTRIALDDFGSGYSALWYLRDLSFDEIKLDRQFIAPLLTDRRAALIVRAVIDLAHDLGGIVVAEGVENAETAARLRDYGCEVAQGFYYSAPLEADAVLLMASRMPGPASTRSS